MSGMMGFELAAAVSPVGPKEPKKGFMYLVLVPKKGIENCQILSYMHKINLFENINFPLVRNGLKKP